MSNSNTVKAKVAQIDFGFTKVEGLMLPDGSYGIGVPQLAEMFQYNQNVASRDFKRLLGGDFSPSKCSTELGKQKINIVTLKTAKKIIKALAKKGNETADSFLDAILEEGLERRFDRAFDQKVEEEERNERLKARVEGKQVRLKLTDAIKWYIENFGDLLSENERKFLYVHVSNSINMALFGRSASKIKKDWNLGKNDLIRDYLEPDELRLYEQAEDTVCRLIYRTVNSEGQPKPKEIAKNVGERLALDIISR